MTPKNFKSRFENDGYYFPLQVLSSKQAADSKSRLTQIAESEFVANLGNRGQINQLHVVCPFVNKIIRSPAILDAVETILGPDLLVWGTSVFMKPPRSQSFVSWHQDLTYWGLNNDHQVAVWVALGPVNRDNGCMRFIPESHLMGQKAHRDVVDESNILTRGQHVDVEFDPAKAVDVVLEPGQASFHHGHLLHCSGANNTDFPRIGIVINYISTSVYQTGSDLDFAMLVRGEDKHNNFEKIPPPVDEFDKAGLELHHRIMSTLNGVLYDGAENEQSALTTPAQ